MAKVIPSSLIRDGKNELEGGGVAKTKGGKQDIEGKLITPAAVFLLSSTGGEAIVGESLE